MTRIARALLRGLIDYAGLFPPAGLGMSETVANYAAYQGRPDSWALARLVVPVARLGEFEPALLALPAALHRDTLWPITGLIGADLTADRVAIEAFNARLSGQARVESVELRVSTVQQIEAARDELDIGLEVYCELPLGAELPALVAGVKRSGLRAKVRTGGVKPGDIPAPEAVLGFLTACATARLEFKATAGLHHPLRGPAPLTYEPNAPCATMFGYLNMILAATALWHHWSEPEALAVLTREARPDQPSIWFSDESVDWGGVGFTADEVERARKEFMLAIGSCSFTEPMSEIAPLISSDPSEVGQS